MFRCGRQIKTVGGTDSAEADGNVALSRIQDLTRDSTLRLPCCRNSHAYTSLQMFTPTTASFA